MGVASPMPAGALINIDPRYMLTAPIPATHKVLQRAGMSIDDIDLIEINEAFASVVLAWEKELHPDMDRVNIARRYPCRNQDAARVPPRSPAA